MAMLFFDYGEIITDVFYNSDAAFYSDYFLREFKKLNEQGYSNSEIKYNVEEVIKLIRSQIEKKFENDLKTYNKYTNEDKILPKEKRYNYPKPDINRIPILRINYPCKRSHILSGLTKMFYLPDIEKIENALTEIFEKTCTGDDGTNLKLSMLKNNFDSVSIKEVYNHFKAGLVDGNYLSENDLLKFLDAAFNKKTAPKKLFKLHDVQAKQKVIRVFGSYYKNIAAKPHGKQNKYAALLGEYFQGYKTRNVSTNFSK